MTLPRITFRDFFYLAVIIGLPLTGMGQDKKQDTVKCKVIVLGSKTVACQQPLIAECGWVVRVYSQLGSELYSDSSGRYKITPYYYNQGYADHFLSYNKKDTLDAWQPFSYKLINW